MVVDLYNMASLCVCLSLEIVARWPGLAMCKRTKSATVYTLQIHCWLMPFSVYNDIFRRVAFMVEDEDFEDCVRQFKHFSKLGKCNDDLLSLLLLLFYLFSIFFTYIPACFQTLEL